ncbi:MAG: DUF3592 domain-containing protein [Flavobacterium sp.]
MNLKKEYSIIIIILFVFFMFYKSIVCALIVGALALYYGIDNLTFLNYINKNGIESLGKILSYESDEEGYKTPIIEFQTLEGNFIKEKPYCYVSSDLSKFRTYKNDINKNITVLYSSERPEKFIIKTEKDFNYGSLIFVIAIGLIFIILTCGNLLGYINMDN